jgi:hypothetical protein
MPFLLKTVVAFLFADGLAKVLVLFSSPASGVFPLFGSGVAYYLILVAVIEFSLSVQFLVRAPYSWLWASLLFATQIFIIFSLFCFEKPVGWLFIGSVGRTQMAAAVITYSFLLFYLLTPSVRRFFQHLQ